MLTVRIQDNIEKNWDFFSIAAAQQTTSEEPAKDSLSKQTFTDTSGISAKPTKAKGLGRSFTTETGAPKFSSRSDRGRSETQNDEKLSLALPAQRGSGARGSNSLRETIGGIAKASSPTKAAPFQKDTKKTGKEKLEKSKTIDPNTERHAPPSRSGSGSATSPQKKFEEGQPGKRGRIEKTSPVGSGSGKLVKKPSISPEGRDKSDFDPSFLEEPEKRVQTAPVNEEHSKLQFKYWPKSDNALEEDLLFSSMKNAPTSKEDTNFGAGSLSSIHSGQVKVHGFDAQDKDNISRKNTVNSRPDEEELEFDEKRGRGSDDEETNQKDQRSKSQKGAKKGGKKRHKVPTTFEFEGSDGEEGDGKNTGEDAENQDEEDESEQGGSLRSIGDDKRKGGQKKLQNQDVVKRAEEFLKNKKGVKGPKIDFGDEDGGQEKEGFDEEGKPTALGGKEVIEERGEDEEASPKVMTKSKQMNLMKIGEKSLSQETSPRPQEVFLDSKLRPSNSHSAVSKGGSEHVQEEDEEEDWPATAGAQEEGKLRKDRNVNLTLNVPGAKTQAQAPEKQQKETPSSQKEKSLSQKTSPRDNAAKRSQKNSRSRSPQEIDKKYDLSKLSPILSGKEAPKKSMFPAHLTVPGSDADRSPDFKNKAFVTEEFDTSAGVRGRGRKISQEKSKSQKTDSLEHESLDYVTVKDDEGAKTIVTFGKINSPVDDASPSKGKYKYDMLQEIPELELETNRDKKSLESLATAENQPSLSKKAASGDVKTEPSVENNEGGENNESFKQKPKNLEEPDGEGETDDVTFRKKGELTFRARAHGEQQAEPKDLYVAGTNTLQALEQRERDYEEEYKRNGYIGSITIDEDESAEPKEGEQGGVVKGKEEKVQSARLRRNEEKAKKQARLQMQLEEEQEGQSAEKRDKSADRAEKQKKGVVSKGEGREDVTQEESKREKIVSPTGKVGKPQENIEEVKKVRSPTKSASVVRTVETEQQQGEEKHLRGKSEDSSKVSPLKKVSPIKRKSPLKRGDGTKSEDSEEFYSFDKSKLEGQPTPYKSKILEALYGDSEEFAGRMFSPQKISSARQRGVQGSELAGLRAVVSEGNVDAIMKGKDDSSKGVSSEMQVASVGEMLEDPKRSQMQQIKFASPKNTSLRTSQVQEKSEPVSGKAASEQKEEVHTGRLQQSKLSEEMLASRRSINESREIGIQVEAEVIEPRHKPAKIEVMHLEPIIIKETRDKGLNNSRIEKETQTKIDEEEEKQAATSLYSSPEKGYRPVVETHEMATSPLLRSHEDSPLHKEDRETQKRVYRQKTQASHDELVSGTSSLGALQEGAEGSPLLKKSGIAQELEKQQVEELQQGGELPVHRPATSVVLNEENIPAGQTELDTQRNPTFGNSQTFAEESPIKPSEVVSPGVKPSVAGYEQLKSELDREEKKAEQENPGSPPIDGSINEEDVEMGPPDDNSSDISGVSHQKILQILEGHVKKQETLIDQLHQQMTPSPERKRVRVAGEEGKEGENEDEDSQVDVDVEGDSVEPATIITSSNTEDPRIKQLIKAARSHLLAQDSSLGESSVELSANLTLSPNREILRDNKAEAKGYEPQSDASFKIKPSSEVSAALEKTEEGSVRDAIVNKISRSISNEIDQIFTDSVVSTKKKLAGLDSQKESASLSQKPLSESIVASNPTQALEIVDKLLKQSSFSQSDHGNQNEGGSGLLNKKSEVYSQVITTPLHKDAHAPYYARDTFTSPNVRMSTHGTIENSGHFATFGEQPYVSATNPLNSSQSPLINVDNKTPLQPASMKPMAYTVEPLTSSQLYSPHVNLGAEAAYKNASSTVDQIFSQVLNPYSGSLGLSQQQPSTNPFSTVSPYGKSIANIGSVVGGQGSGTQPANTQAYNLQLGNKTPEQYYSFGGDNQGSATATGANRYGAGYGDGQATSYSNQMGLYSMAPPVQGQNALSFLPTMQVKAQSQIPTSPERFRTPQAQGERELRHAYLQKTPESRDKDDSSIMYKTPDNKNIKKDEFDSEKEENYFTPVDTSRKRYMYPNTPLAKIEEGNEDNSFIQGSAARLQQDRDSGRDSARRGYSSPPYNIISARSSPGYNPLPAYSPSRTAFVIERKAAGQKFSNAPAPLQPDIRTEDDVMDSRSRGASKMIKRTPNKFDVKFLWGSPNRKFYQASMEK